MAIENEYKLIKAARMLDGKSNVVMEKPVVITRGSEIHFVGTEEGAKWYVEQVLAAGCGFVIEEFNYPDATILPGLVDTHVHINWFGDGRPGDEIEQYPTDLLLLQSAQNIEKHLKSGVTTIRDCGSKHQTAFFIKDAVRLGIIPGPRMVICGRPITITGGHTWYMGGEANGKIGVTNAVRQLIKEGADFIKIIATGGSTKTSVQFRQSFNREEIKVIVEESHKLGKLTAAHCVGNDGILNALEAGVDTIIHCRFFDTSGSPSFDQDIAKRISDTGTWVDATVAQAWARQLQLESEERQGRTLTIEEKYEINQIEEARAIQKEHFQKMLNMGVKMVSGSDSAWMYYPMGGFQYEIIGHAEWGMTNIDAIISGTGAAAECIGLGDTVGTLEVGKKADILVVDGDPTTNIWDLLNVNTVFLDGQKV